MSDPVRTLTAPEDMKVFVGVVVQPLVAAAVAVIGFPIFLLDRNGRALAGGTTSDLMGAAIGVAIIIGVVALVITVAVALPAALWLMKRRRIALQEALIAGLVFGNVPFALGGVTAGTHGIAGLIGGLAFSSSIGAACGAAFWGIALRQSVDSEPGTGQQSSS